jgi:hypothetical protein
MFTSDKIQEAKAGILIIYGCSCFGICQQNKSRKTFLQRETFTDGIDGMFKNYVAEMLLGISSIFRQYFAKKFSVFVENFTTKFTIKF